MMQPSLPHRSLKLVADENMPGLDQLFAHFGQLHALPGRSLQPQDVADADILLVRSVTQVDRHLLQHSAVKFVGSATIGTDHLDLDWLTEQGIHVCNAPGCNADSVADYVIASLALLSRHQSHNWLQGKRAAVIGAGNVGGRVISRLQGLGMQVLACDPPRQAAGLPCSAPWSSLTEALQADIICLHTPLTRHGPHPTYHLLGPKEVTQIRAGSVLLNAGRGDVIDNQALLQRMQRNADLHLVLDVWENEPMPLQPLLAYCQIATPHIAGYSLDGRFRGSAMIYQALCHWLQQEASLDWRNFLPACPITQLSLIEADWPTLLRLPSLLIDLESETQRFKNKIQNSDNDPSQFDWLRKTYPLARELHNLTVKLDKASADTYNCLKAMGFSVI
ncbi:4-phosphoerythronate dehydrogenase [Balneatrix alpica]|uniref:4-phosphoerythronate dehydrogenase n=1 Tax=Balneatrix alpica TaxID=75684 RepID=UPI002739D3FD|nr:4-phosphoerythronate dehydrogenase [Balneatrix alpica]